MYNYDTFVPTQNHQQSHLKLVSPTRSLPAKTLQNNSPAYFPVPQSQWNEPPVLPVTKKSNSLHTPLREKKKDLGEEEIPYNIRILLDGEEKDESSTSSDSEETDTMPEAFPNPWSFGLQESLRRKSEPFPSGSPLTQKIILGLQSAFSSNSPSIPTEKVNISQVTFTPFNTPGFVTDDKKAYFVTLQGFNTIDGRRIFRIDRLCHSVQPETPEEAPFLFLDLWNEIRMGLQKETDNIFEPLTYSIPCVHFKVVLTIYISHCQEDPYHIEFMVDLRQHAFSSDKQSQSLEVVFTESPRIIGNNNANEPKSITGNVVTIHAHLNNENQSMLQQQAQTTPLLSFFSGAQSNIKPPQQQNLNDFRVILRQIFIRLPLCRSQNTAQRVPFVAPHEIPRTHNVYGKRGSAIVLGQGFGSPVPIKPGFQSGPMSPISWGSNSVDTSPTYKKRHSSEKDPELPPGILSSKFIAPVEIKNQMPGGSLFKFRNQGQQRFSVQVIQNEPESDSKKRNNRILSTDFSHLIEGDNSPMKVLETFVNVVKSNNRRQSQTSEESTMSNFKSKTGAASIDNDFPSQSISTLNASSFAESIPNIVQETDEAPKVNSEPQDDFKIEDYIGKIADLAKTNQGCKSLQKYVQNVDKDGLDVIIQEICERVGELMLDTYANYFIQTVVQKGNLQQRLRVLQKMSSSFINIARDKKGTHSLQAVLAHVTSPEEFNLIKNIVGHYVFELSMDSRANYVIQKLISIIPVEYSHFLYQPLFENFVQIANNSFGLLVLKQMMAKVDTNEHLRQRVVEFTCLNFEKLIQNPYGNYAIQYVIEFYPKDSQMIMSKILLKIIPYSSQKISSNVIEKCLAVCDPHFRRRIVEEILRNGRLGDLMKNKYGNFVTLQLLATSTANDKQRLMQEILRCANAFNGTKYKTRWLKFIQDNPMNIPVNPNGNFYSVQEDTRKGEKNDTEEKGFNAESLEAVKKIWRDMTKDEKNDTSPYFHGKHSHARRSFN